MAKAITTLGLAPKTNDVG